MAQNPPVKTTDDDVTNAVYETVIEIWMRLFEDSIQTFLEDDPEEPVSAETIEQFRQDYKAATEFLLKLHQETKGNFTMQQVLKALPDNLWAQWQDEVLTELPRESRRSEKGTRQSGGSFRRAARRRKAKKDVM